MRRRAPLIGVGVAVIALAGAAAPPPGPVEPAAPAEEARPDLADAPPVEDATLRRLLGAAAWPRRAIGAARLERYGCAGSRALLQDLLADPAWQVRAFAVRSLGRRRVPAGAAWFAAEGEPRVLRTALRHRYAIDAAHLDRGVRALARSADRDDNMLAAEIGAASGDEALRELARETAKRVILRMDRVEAGTLSPRLARLTGQPNLRRAHRWQRWLLRAGRSFAVEPGLLVGAPDRPDPPSRLAALPPDQFAALEAYIEALGTRSVDLAICLDCTASMSGELAAAQGGIDDLITFVGAVVAEFRVGLVGYRDRRDRFQTKGWDFTSDLAAVRRNLWQLTAEGGGDSREGVHPAMKMACTKLSWDPEHVKVLILVGDAPPHVGFGGQCADLARRGAEHGLTTHAIEADGKPVEHFAEIAAAGGGRCVPLADDELLIPEIAGLTLGDAFAEELREFFAIFLELCR